MREEEKEIEKEKEREREVDRKERTEGGMTKRLRLNKSRFLHATWRN